MQDKLARIKKKERIHPKDKFRGPSEKAATLKAASS